ncbi:MAG: ArsA family ATPase [Deltaproteobacteria bacterium]|nr:ArsA family ATPase [Deltaproteobacteria bacterium]
MIQELIQRKKILICCGSGGVGKTTLSSSLALYAALQGKKVLVLTIDPAKRLTEALGIKNVGHQRKRVEIGGHGELYVQMLDTKQAFDDLITSLSPSQDVVEKIIKNPIYQNVSHGLSGVHEYMATSKLYECYQEKKFDVIILDTPPMKKAFDFLEAPQKIADFFDAKIFHWFLKPYFHVGKAGFKFLVSSSAFVLKIIERFSGMEVLESMHGFFLNFEGMYESFHQRALSIHKLLKSPQCGFLLISSSGQSRFSEIKVFCNVMKKKSLSFEGIIFNQVLPLYKRKDISLPKIVAEKNLSFFKEEKYIRVFSKIIDYLDDFEALALRERTNTQLLLEELDIEPSSLYIPRFSEEIHNIQGLKAFHPYFE